MTSTIATAPSTPTFLLYAKAFSKLRNADLDIALPEIRLVHLGFRISPEHLARYRLLCGFTRADEIPLTYIYVMSLRLQLALVIDQRFPFRTVGLVHTACAMRWFQDIDPAAPLDLSIGLEAGAPVKSGREIVFHIEALQHDQRSAECSATFRVRGPRVQAQGTKPKATAPMSGNPVHAIDFAANIGRAYARLSGDYNPIHLSPLLARIFGFRTAIAQGMYSAARVLALAREHSGHPIRAMEVSFKRPVPLPSVGLLRFGERGDGNVDFEMARRDDTVVALLGRCVNA